MSEQPQVLTITLSDNDYILNGPLETVIGSLNALLAAVPEEFRSSVTMKCEIDHGYYDSGASLEFSISYQRLETPAEMAQRLAKEAAEREQMKRSREVAERREFDRLKAKFGT